MRPTASKALSGSLAVLGVGLGILGIWLSAERSATRLPAFSDESAALEKQPERALEEDALVHPGGRNEQPAPRREWVPTAPDSLLNSKHGALRVRAVYERRSGATAPLIVSVRAEGLGSLSLHTDQLVPGGELLFEHLTPGRVLVSIGQRATRVARVRPGEIELVEFTIPAGVRLLGRVVDQAGIGVENAALWLAQEPTDPESALVVATTGVDGTFELHAVAPGSAVAAHSPHHQASPMLIIAGDPGSEMLLTLQVGPEATVVRGRVQDASGRAIASALVFVGVRLDASLGLDPALTLNGARPPCSTLTDESGGFALHGLAPNETHPVWVGKHGYATSRTPCRPSSVDEVLVIELEPEALIKGTVVHADGSPAESVALWCISRLFTPENSEFSGPGWAADCAFSDAHGEFLLPGLHSGPGLLRARLDAQWADMQVSLPAGDALHVEVVLQTDIDEPALALPGMVRDARGRPVPGARVIVTADDGSQVFALSDEGGAIELANAPGRARLIEVWDERTTWPYAVIQRSDAQLWPWLEIELPYPELAAGISGELPPGVVAVTLQLQSGARVHQVRAEAVKRRFETEPLPPGVYELRAVLEDAGALELGAVELVPGELLDLGRLQSTEFGRLEIAVDFGAATLPDEVSLFLQRERGGPSRALSIRSGHGAFEDVVAGTYTLSLWDPRFAFHSRTLRIEAGATTEFTLQAEDGQEVRFLFEDRVEELSMLQFIWKRAADDETLWDMGMLPWSHQGLAQFKQRFLPGSYRLEVHGSRGLETRVAFSVDPGQPPPVVRVHRLASAATH